MRRASALLLGLFTLISILSCAGSGDALARRHKRRHHRKGASSMRVGCQGAKFLPVPADAATDGPWPVGLRTVHAAGVTADVYYPAAIGSEVGAARATFDLRDHLPPALAEQIKAAKLPAIPCRCSRDLRIDDAHGPYPVVFFFHGRGLTRAEFPTLCAHLASRGFVVVSPDLPGVHLADYFEGEVVPDRAAPIEALVAEVARPSGELGFLTGRTDGKVGLVGHSLGAYIVQKLIDEHGDVAVVMGGAGLDVRRRVPKLIMGGTADGFAPFPGQERGFETSAPPKRLVGVKGAGHMQFADHCNVSPEFGGWYGQAVAYGVPFSGFLLKLAEKGCADAEVPYQQAHGVILAAVTAELEETLTCSRGASDTFEELQDRPDVGEYREQEE
jgi:predicted dienelactone hydrolase